MAIKYIEGSPEKLYKEVTTIVADCFEGIWSAEDLLQLIEIPHENKLFLIAYDNDKPVGYAFVVADYFDAVDTKIATIQEIGVLSEYRDSEIADVFIEKALLFSKGSNAELLEQIVSTIDQWLIPVLLNKKLRPSEIKADREISSFNEAKLILNNLRKNPKLKVLMNQLFFEVDNELESYIIESEEDFETITKKNPIAFGSVISVEKTDDLDKTLKELNKIEIEWDEIGITFDFMF
ncbi:MAG: GNAT family N-acetyltransferase [Asgard group archaeon]|nr:GNAT family N-acetyltransferase [Asgard group archaeon]